MGVNGVAAANTMLGYNNVRHGYCLYYVWQAYAAHGARTRMSSPTAYDCWNKSQGKHHGDRNPPAGVPVFWGPKPGSSAGDVVISLGGGRVVATDYPNWGQVNVTTIAERERQIGRPYLGWTERIFDVVIDYSNSGKLAEDGILGPATVRALQKVLGVAQDGDWGPATTTALQKKLVAVGYRIAVDGQLGPATIKALQTYILGAKFADGEIGPQTIRGLQHYLNSGGVFPTPEVLDVDGLLGPQTIKRLQRAFGVTQDGDWGPDTTRAIQKFFGVTQDGILGPITIKALQRSLGVDADGEIGPVTIKAIQTWLNKGGTLKVVPEPAKPKPERPDTEGTEAEYTPNLKTPEAKDFPSWIRFETVLDPDGQKPNTNKDAAAYYKNKYNPIESHTHWWNEPGKGGTHDGNVNYIKNTADLSVNFVVSENRVTLMVPLNKIALTTGSRNPFAWKSENDPTLTEQQYKTMGYLHYIVEKLNPTLLNEPIRLHKEFSATSCADIDTSKVRAYAEKFRTGELDPATGLPPDSETPNPDLVKVPREILKTLSTDLRKVVDYIDGLLD